MNFSGRLPLGTAYPVTITKHGPYLNLTTLNDEPGASTQILACGLACSEIFHSQLLAKVLTPSHLLESSILTALNSGAPAAALSLHTSAGILPALQLFLDAVTPHLPTSFQTPDALTSLQLTGTDAVWAGVDLLLTLQTLRGTPHKNKVAVASRSYHGPGTSAFGTSQPLGPSGKTPLQCFYPSPAMFNRYSSETLPSFHARCHAEFVDFLSANSNVGVLLVEPQSGSSCIAQPWDKELLVRYISTAKEHGVLVLADEIMCGLTRHGQVETFLSRAWGLSVDAITFGKGVAAGVEPIAGVCLRQGKAALESAGKSVLQSHTYAGASARALTTATSVLNALSDGSVGQRVRDLGERVVGPMFEAIKERGGGVLGVQGQGLMWGGYFNHPDLAERQAAVKLFKECCGRANVLPYYVPSGGFMFTPVLDVSEEMLRDAGARLGSAVEEVASLLRARGWTAASTSGSVFKKGSKRKASDGTYVLARYKGPTCEDMDSSQKAIYDDIKRTRSTGTAGPFGPWLANANVANYAQNLGRTCRYDLANYSLRESEMVILCVAAGTRAVAEWDIHVGEARAAGVGTGIISAIWGTWGGGAPIDQALFDSLSDASIYNFAEELCRDRRVCDEVYWNLHAWKGDAGVVELVALVGYYNLVSMTLNTFQIKHEKKGGEKA